MLEILIKVKRVFQLRYQAIHRFRNKKSSQLQRTKLSNYIQNKDSRSNEPEVGKPSQLINNNSVIKPEIKSRDSPDEKAFESTSVICK